MYEVALGTYDLELVKLVASHTQKDPKEYLPYLEKLSQIQNEIDRKATIQVDLKNYEKAVKELAKGTEEQKCQALKLIEKHEKFRVGLTCFSENPEYLKSVKVLLG
jgi:elongator complex protein 1